MKKFRLRKRKKKRKTKNNSPEFIAKLLKAIEGSGGVVAVIAARMNKKYITMWKILEKAPEKVQDAIDYEKEYVGDIAEITVKEMMEQRFDFGTALRAARGVLKSKNHKKRGYTEEKEMSIQGGKKPIKVQNENLISMDKLKTLPIDVRKRMLEEIEEKEEDDG